MGVQKIVDLDPDRHAKWRKLRNERADRLVHLHKLLRNLTSRHYNCTEDEAQTLIEELVEQLSETAADYEVPFAGFVGSDAVDDIMQPQLPGLDPHDGGLNITCLVKVLEALNADDIRTAKDLIRSAIKKQTGGQK